VKGCIFVETKKKDMEKNNTALKAWRLKTSEISEGYHYTDDVVYADTRGTAKTLWLREIDPAELMNGDTITYLNIPIARAKDHDRGVYKGDILKPYQIRQREREEEKQKELMVILADSEISHCYIRKGGVYYRPNCCGYTEFQLFAGIYTKQEAAKYVTNCDELTAVPINTKEHNEYLNENILKIQSRLIQ
jgi:hypothetical protein